MQCALVSALEKLVVLERQTSDERLEGNVEKTVTKTDLGPRGGREMVSTKPAREGCVGMSAMLAHRVCSGVCWTWGAEWAPGVREMGAARASAGNKAGTAGSRLLRKGLPCQAKGLEKGLRLFTLEATGTARDFKLVNESQGAFWKRHFTTRVEQRQDALERPSATSQPPLSALPATSPRLAFTDAKGPSRPLGFPSSLPDRSGDFSSDPCSSRGTDEPSLQQLLLGTRPASSGPL